MCGFTQEIALIRSHKLVAHNNIGLHFTLENLLFI